VEGARLPIGMFSRASSISIKTLRSYHESGLLVPAWIDGATNYRGYTVDQLADAATIVGLRALDLPLAQVREILDARDPEVTHRILASHRDVMQDRLDEAERIVVELATGVAPLTHTPVHVRDDPPVLAVCSTDTISVAHLWERLDETFTRIDAAVHRGGASATDVRGAHYGPDIDDDDWETVEAFVPVAEAIDLPGRDGLLVRELPPRRWAVLVHVGELGGLVDTYRTLGAWVARHETASGAPVRERYLVGAPDTDEPAQYRTEVAWPIA